MKLDDLKNSGAFITGEPVSKTVTWKKDDGQEVTFDVRVRRFSMGDWERIQFGSEEEKSASARIISHAIFLEDDIQFTYDQAFQLHAGLAAVLLNAHNEVNRRTPAKKA